MTAELPAGYEVADVLVGKDLLLCISHGEARAMNVSTRTCQTKTF